MFFAFIRAKRVERERERSLSDLILGLYDVERNENTLDMLLEGLVKVKNKKHHLKMRTALFLIIYLNRSNSKLRGMSKWKFLFLTWLITLLTTQ
jgi:hypothetical protein